MLPPAIQSTTGYQRFKDAADRLKRDLRIIPNPYLLYPISELQTRRTAALAWIADHQDHKDLYEAKERLRNIERALQKKEQEQLEKDVTDVLL